MKKTNSKKKVSKTTKITTPTTSGINPLEIISSLLNNEIDQDAIRKLLSQDLKTRKGGAIQKEIETKSGKEIIFTPTIEHQEGLTREMVIQALDDAMTIEDETHEAFRFRTRCISYKGNDFSLKYIYRMSIDLNGWEISNKDFNTMEALRCLEGLGFKTKTV